MKKWALISLLDVGELKVDFFLKTLAREKRSGPKVPSNPFLKKICTIISGHVQYL